MSRWTEKEIEILKEMYPTKPTRLIAEKLGRTVMAVRTYARNVGVKKAPDYNYMLDSINAVPQEKKDFIRENYNKYTNPELVEITGASETTIRKVAQKYGLRKEVNTGSFPKGHVPHNKGKKMSEYMSPEAIDRIKKTRFKKGLIPHNTRKDGDVRLETDKTGREYYYIRIGAADWQLLHRVIYKRHHGHIPPGMIVTFRDGNSRNLAIDNLELISRGENAKRNSNFEKAMQTMEENQNHPSRHLTDNYIASLIGKGDDEMKEIALENKGLIRVYRKNIKLKRKIKKHEENSG